MTTRESKTSVVTPVNEKSLNFELAKLKQRIQANSLHTSKTNLYIFTKEYSTSA